MNNNINNINDTTTTIIIKNNEKISKKKNVSKHVEKPISYYFLKIIFREHLYGYFQSVIKVLIRCAR